MEIILASTSPIRSSILHSAGVSCRIMKPVADEVQLKSDYRGELLGLPRFLACEKALSISSLAPTALVIGADQVLEQDGRLFSKPTTRHEARLHLTKLRGKTHRLISALSCCQHGQELWSHQDEASLTMRNFTDTFLDGYLDAVGDDATSSVGAYKLERTGIQLFETVAGDHFTILGLPLLPLLQFLRDQDALPT